MKTTTSFHKNIPGLLCFFLLAGGLLVSCKKDDAVDTSAPVITGVTTTLDYTVSLNSAARSAWVMIHGQHLKTIQVLKFNSISIPDSVYYANDSTITVKIPAQVADTINNLITVTTKYGTATYNFVVQLPAPAITSFAPGIAATGANITITGTELISTKSVLFGNQAATIVKATDTTVTVTVPSGASGTYITLTTAGGTVTTSNMFGASLVIYDDALASPWWSGGWSGTTTLGTTGQVLRGANAITRVSDAWGAFALGGAGIGLSSYKAIKLSVYGGSGTAGKLVKLVLNSAASSGQTLSINEGKWTTYTVLLSNLGSPATLTDIWLQEFSGAGGLTVYFDDVVLL